MDLIYLDYNCFQRNFDDFSQMRIQMESLACQGIFGRAEREEIQLLWSFMHEDENALCPFPERKEAVLYLRHLCEISITPENEILLLAETFLKNSSLSPKDALHLACAVHVRASHFLTCDDRLIKRGAKLKLKIELANPVEYIWRKEDERTE